MDKKDVLIKIKGMQFAEDNSDDDIVESMTMGTLEQVGDKYIIKFDEVIDDMEEPVKSTIICKEGFMEIKKVGVVNVCMLFEEGKEVTTNYATSFGDIVLQISGKAVTIQKSDLGMEIIATYGLAVDYGFLGECKVAVNLEYKENK